MMVPETISDLVGIAVIIVLTAIQYLLGKKNRTPKLPAEQAQA